MWRCWFHSIIIESKKRICLLGLRTNSFILRDVPSNVHKCLHPLVSKTIGFAVAAFHSAAINKLQAPWWASIQNNSIQQVFSIFCGFLVWFGFHPCASCGGPHFSITLHYNRVNYMTHIIQTAIAPSSRHEPVISVLLPITSIRLQVVRLINAQILHK